MLLFSVLQQNRGKEQQLDETTDSSYELKMQSQLLLLGFYYHDLSE